MPKRLPWRPSDRQLSKLLKEATLDPSPKAKAVWMFLLAAEPSALALEISESAGVSAALKGEAT